MSHIPRVFLPALGDVNLPVETNLSAEDSHHLHKVLRMRAGEHLLVIDNSTGKEYEAIIVDSGKSVSIKIHEERTTLKPTSIIRHLAFALAKNDHNDFVCEKGTELGAENILFWQAERSVVRAEATDLDKRLERWKRIAVSASKQCGRVDIPQIYFASDVQSLVDTVKRTSENNDRRILLSLSTLARPLRSFGMPGGKICLVVGPAGDITSTEESYLVNNNYELGSLGPRTLRAETAAVAAMAAVEALWG